MRIALAQMDCVVGDVGANLTKIGRFAGEAKAAGCGVMFLPELATTGYDAAAVGGSGGDDAAAVRAAAAEHGIAIVCGVTERVGEVWFNSLAAVDADGGAVAGYRKMHLFDGTGAWEPEAFTPGDEPVVAGLLGERWGLSICYDLRFPELYRALIDRGRGRW